VRRADAPAAWAFVSGGLPVTVAGPVALAAWWPRLAPQIPGVGDATLCKTTAPAGLMLPPNITVDDARRRINAHVHVEHLRRGALSLHGVAVVKDERAVLLMGGHGVGKSLTALALITDWAWQPVAGDVAVVRAGTGGVEVVGGTGAYLVRRSAIRRWFPELAMPSGAGERIDLSRQLRRPTGSQRRTVVAAAVPCLDGTVRAEAAGQPYKAQDTRNAVYRASTYLIDKALDDPAADPLWLVETEDLARRRARLARDVADQLGLRWFGASPSAIAAAIDLWTCSGGAR
jgi:hypothetical protein